jgi:putative SOS response-associated peptidase YedK
VVSLHGVCGRFTLTTTAQPKLRRRFDLDASVRLEETPRFNIAPTDPVLTIRERDDGGRDAGRLRWGLMSGREAGAHKSLINARAETLDSKPAFRESFRERRCLIAADGFYEWRTDDRGKQPMWINRADDEPFAFAGIWAEAPGRNGTPVVSCAIVTCEPNELMRSIHDRMPVILDPDAEGEWLSPAADPRELLSLLRPARDEELQVREVTDAVNDVRNDGPGLLESPLRLF